VFNRTNEFNEDFQLEKFNLIENKFIKIKWKTRTEKVELNRWGRRSNEGRREETRGHDGRLTNMRKESLFFSKPR